MMWGRGWLAPAAAVLMIVLAGCAGSASADTAR